MLAVLVAIGPSGYATVMDFEVFKDPEDGALDLSEWLMTRHGFLPVPIIITEPAIGPGLGLAAVFFHGGFAGKPASGDSGRMLPPSVTAAAAAYTSNGTSFVGGGHFGSWKQDTIRYAGFAGMINLNIDFYAHDSAVSFNIDGGFLLQEAKFRIGDSNFFLGGKWLFFDSTSTIDEAGGQSFDFPEIGEDGFKSTNSGLGAVAGRHPFRRMPTSSSPPGRRTGLSVWLSLHRFPNDGSGASIRGDELLISRHWSLTTIQNSY